jgi:hypothetical protein
MFVLISAGDIVMILTLKLTMISQCDINHIIPLQMKTIMYVMKAYTDITTTRTLGLTTILTIVFISTLKLSLFYMYFRLPEYDLVS